MVKKFTVTDDDLEEMIFKYCRDFTALERKGRFDPITGREKEIDDTILILLQKGRKNVALLAPAGVGKTALCVGLAQRIVKGDVPDYLKNARLLEVDMASMAAGTSTPAEFQGRFIPLCRGIAERYHHPEYPKMVMFLDEMHTLMPTCTGSGYAGLSEVMKPYLTVGDLHVVGATTLDEFRIYVAEDPALDRRFQKIFLRQPNVLETYRILQALRPGYEKHHKVTMSNDLLLLIVKLTNEHMRKRNQPDKSIITMDAAMAYQVKEHGTGTEVSLESMYYMVGRETGLNTKALHDEKKVHENTEEVKDIEARIASGVFDPIADEHGQDFKEYDPSKSVKIVMSEEERVELERSEAENETLAEKRAEFEEAEARAREAQKIKERKQRDEALRKTQD